MLLNYKEFGEGQPLIVIHGFLGASDNWQTIGKSLAELNYKVILPDLRNHGSSFHHDEFSLQDMAADIRKLAATLELESPVIIGHSLGGKVAMRFTLDYPDKIKKLVVVDIAPKKYPVHHDKILHGLSSIKPDEITSRGDADKTLAEYIPDYGMRQFLLKNLARNSEGQYYWRFNLPVLKREVANVTVEIHSDKSVPIPALFIRGERSDYILDEDIPGIKKIFPEARIETVENAGHFTHAEQPEKVFNLIKGFIE